MFRKLSGYRTYIITARRIISGDEFKQRNGLTGFLGLGMAIALLNPPHFQSGAFALN
jgi:hypothetical protein